MTPLTKRNIAAFDFAIWNEYYIINIIVRILFHKWVHM